MTPDERLHRAQQELRDARAARRAAQQPAAPRNNNRGGNHAAANNNRRPPAAAPAAPAVSPKVQFWLVVVIGLFLLFTGTFYMLRLSGGVRNTLDYEASVEGKEFVLAREQTRKLEEKTKQEQERTKQVQAVAAVNPTAVAGLLPVAGNLPAVSPTSCEGVVFSVKAGDQRQLKRNTILGNFSNDCKALHGFYVAADPGTVFSARQCNGGTSRQYRSDEMSDEELINAIKSGCVEIAVKGGRVYAYLKRR